MPKSLTQYRVFIASPSGLDEERKCFRRNLEKFTALHAEPVGVTFHPVGWEETVGGVGRPQELINEDLKECDYAVFVLHDRWGLPPGGARRIHLGWRKNGHWRRSFTGPRRCATSRCSLRTLIYARNVIPANSWRQFLCSKSGSRKKNDIFSGNTPPSISLPTPLMGIWQSG